MWGIIFSKFLKDLSAPSELNLAPTIRELKSAVGVMANNKAAGLNGIPAEVYKHGGDTFLKKLLDLFLHFWEREELPHDFNDALIVTIYKKKGKRQDCGNYSGISLLSIADKNLGAWQGHVQAPSDCGQRHSPITVWFPCWS